MTPCQAEDVEKVALEFADSLAASEADSTDLDEELIEELLGMEFDGDEDDDLFDTVVFGEEEFDEEEDLS